MVDHLRHALDKLVIMHFFCFTAKLIQKFMYGYNKNSYIHNLIMMCTVPAYQFVIFKAYYEIVLVEKLALQLRCTGFSFVKRRAWIYIEICAFAVNIIQLVYCLFKTLKPCGGGACCNERFELLIDENYDDDMDDKIRQVEEIVGVVKDELKAVSPTVHDDK